MPFTTYGKSALASATTNSYIPPLYLVIDTTSTTLTQPQNIGDVSVSCLARIDQTGDTTIVVGLAYGGLSQEVCTFTSVTGAGPYVYHLSAGLKHAHATGELVVRNPTVNDTMANIFGEVPFDPVNSPGMRAQVPAGYSPGTGQWDMGFYLTAAQALYVITLAGVSDSPLIGQGNLHGYLSIGWDHTAGTRDLEIDIIVTLS